MAITTGAILEEWGPPQRALREVQRQIRDFCGPPSEADYVIDLAFRTWHRHREPELPYGVSPGMVGRTQRRFIVWLSVPRGLETTAAVCSWLVGVLPETERLVREHVPGRSRAYPVEQLAQEVAALQAHLAQMPH